MEGSRDIASLVDRLGHTTYGDGYRDGLKPAQWSALRYFAIANRFSNSTSAYARYQGITAGAASQTITTLVQKRLLQRQRDESDGRRHNLVLTNDARRLISLDPIQELVLAAENLDAEQKLETARSLKKMLSFVLRRNGGDDFGYCADCCFLRDEGSAKGFQCIKFAKNLCRAERDLLCVNFVRDKSID